MHGIFVALLSGALWGGIWHLVLSMGLILTTGASLTLQVGPSVAAGAAIRATSFAWSYAHTRTRTLAGRRALVADQATIPFAHDATCLVAGPLTS